MVWVDAILGASSAEVFTAFTVLSLVVFALSAIAAWLDFESHADTLAASVMLGLLVQLSAAVRAGPPGPLGIGETAWMAVFDLAALALTAYWLRCRWAWWKLAVIAVFVLMLGAHAGAYFGWSGGHNPKYVYILTLNLLGVLHFSIVGGIGARCVASALDALVFGLGRHRLHVRHGPPR